jgi:hypothetical protein
MDDQTRELGIGIEPEAGPPRGWVRDADGAKHPFSGWLGLASVLGRVLEQTGPTAGQPTADHTRIGGTS